MQLARGTFYLHGLTLIPAWMGDYIHYEVWDEITYLFRIFNNATVKVWEWIRTGHVIINPFPNFNDASVEVSEWISNIIPPITGHVITNPRRNLS